MRKSKPFQMPEFIWQSAEKIAQERRLQTGELVHWTDVIHEVLRKGLIPRKRKPRQPKPE